MLKCTDIFMKNPLWRFLSLMKTKTKEMIPLLELLHHYMYVARDEGGHAAQIVCFGDGLTAERIVKGHPAFKVTLF